MQTEIGSQKVSLAQVGSVSRMGVSMEYSAFLDLFHNAQIRGRMHKLCDKAIMLFKMMNLNIILSQLFLANKLSLQGLRILSKFYFTKIGV